MEALACRSRSIPRRSLILRPASAGRAKVGQLVGNFNSLSMMRVRETATADAQGGISFSSSTQDRVSSVQVPLLEPASLMQLPKGQAFALREGGQLWKLRILLPDAARNQLMPENIAQIARMNLQGFQAWRKLASPQHEHDIFQIQLDEAHEAWFICRYVELPLSMRRQDQRVAPDCSAGSHCCPEFWLFFASARGCWRSHWSGAFKKYI